MVIVFKNVKVKKEDIDNCIIEIIKVIKKELPEEVLTTEVLKHIILETNDYIKSLPLNLDL